MIFTAQIKVMPLKELLDPQGKAVLGGLQNLGMAAVTDVRIGKHIDLRVDADSKEEARHSKGCRHRRQVCCSLHFL